MKMVNYFQNLFVMFSILYLVIEYDETQTFCKFEKDILTIS